MRLKAFGGVAEYAVEPEGTGIVPARREAAGKVGEDALSTRAERVH
jgi:hypothetical protein